MRSVVLGDGWDGVGELGDVGMVVLAMFVGLFES